MDVLIVNGTIVDGTGRPRRMGAVRLRDGRIISVGEDDGGVAERIDADGLVVAPGFIDSHTHLDGQLFWDPLGSPGGMNGYTTVVLGNCGFSLAGDAADADYGISVMAGVEQIPREPLATAVPFGWSGFAGYADALEQSGLAVNAASYVAYPIVRHQVMGDRAFHSDAATPEDRARIQEVLDAALDAGALGVSFNRFGGDRDDLGRQVAGWDAPWPEVAEAIAVLRDHPGTLVQALPRWITAGEPGGSHFAAQARDRRPQDVEAEAWATALAAAGRPMVWGPLLDTRFEELIRLSGAGKTLGVRISAGIAPKPLGTIIDFHLANHFGTIPDWHFLFDLDLPARLHALKDPTVRERLAASVGDDYATIWPRSIFDSSGNLVQRGFELRWPWDSMYTVAAAPRRFDAKETLKDEAVRTGRRPVDVMLDHVVDTDGDVFFWAALCPWDEDRSLAMLRHPDAVVSTNDSGAHLLNVSDQAAPFLLGHQVRRADAISLEHGVHLLTGRQAGVFQLADRGTIEPGKAADLVLFDPDTIDALGPEVRYDLPGGEPRLVTAAQGVNRVVVGGTTIVVDGVATGAMPGTFLRPRTMAGR